MSVEGNWERRWQALLDEWVVISASSAERPWSGASATASTATVPAHDPACYLCPGVTRANGQANPDYHGPFAFDNDFPSLSGAAPNVRESADPLAVRAPAGGRCRVLCWSERHDATLASLAEADMLIAARLWQSEYALLSADPAIDLVQIFENKGTEIGVSNLHPHGQIYACGFVTKLAERMRATQAGHVGLLQAMRDHPRVQDALVVERNAFWSVIVPFAPRFAYETWIVPHRHVMALDGLDEPEVAELAGCYQRQVRRYDLLFRRSAPNVSLLYNAPSDGHPDNRHWCFHVQFHPPLRDPSKMKFLAGFESAAGNIINPVQPEQAAAQLRAIDVSEWSSLALAGGFGGSSGKADQENADRKGDSRATRSDEP